MTKARRIFILSAKLDAKELYEPKSPFKVMFLIILSAFPFIIIAPSFMLTSVFFKKLFGDGGMQILIPPKRLEFLKDGEKAGRASFECFFYCWKLGLEKDLTFLPNPIPSVLC